MTQITFNFGLDTTSNQVNKENWKTQILTTYEKLGESDYEAELVETITDNLPEDTDDELIEFIYEDASLSNLLDHMTLKSMRCIENNADSCIMEFTTLFDTTI